MRRQQDIATSPSETQDGPATDQVAGPALPQERLGTLRAAGCRAPRRRSPSSTITPSSMKTTRSATSRAKPISWVTTIIVMPSRGQVAHHRRARRRQLGVERARSARRTASCPGPSTAPGRSPPAAAGRRTGAPGRRRPCPASPTLPEVPRATSLASALRSRLSTSLLGDASGCASTVRCGNRLNCWNTMPILVRTSSTSTSGSVISIALDEDPALRSAPPAG